MTVCCFGRENDHRHRGEQLSFLRERHRERERERNSKKFTHFQIFPNTASRDASPDGRVPRKKTSFDARFPGRSRGGGGGGVSFFGRPGRRRRQAPSSTFARIGLSTLSLLYNFLSPLLIFHRMFASFRCLHFSFMHVFFSPPPEDARWGGGTAARLE